MKLFDAYPNDTRHMRTYIGYQARYRDAPRESDKVLINLLAGSTGTLLDIGCSTGNLLRHIRKAHPHLKLIGGDTSESQIDACISDSGLLGIGFQILDVRSLPADSYDVVVANAILYGFDVTDLSIALLSIRRSLKKGGRLVAFDFFHPFKQDVFVLEKSEAFPDGHPMHFKSYASTETALAVAGFRSHEFHPFEIPIELPFNGYDSIATHTRKGLQYRGCLSQPWCHLVATV